MSTQCDVRKVPADITVVHLNNDGSYETTSTLVSCPIYIEDTQVFNIWNPDVAKAIRARYGDWVGVMHRHPRRVQCPRYRTMMHILGR